ncbi:MAG: hypothetical protein JXN63_00085, partial [Candidatus Delongbacteria bacterium]|nr:hypothetical protein [Candidatus Delongbacteria bacterium]
MRGRCLITGLLCLILLGGGVPLTAERSQAEKEASVKKAALITGGVLGLGAVGIYCAGPYTGFHTEDTDPWVVPTLIGVSSVLTISSTVLY